MKFMKNSLISKHLSNNHTHHHHSFQLLLIKLIDAKVNLGDYILFLSALLQSLFTIIDKNPILFIMIVLHHVYILGITKDVVLKDTLSNTSLFFNLSRPNHHRFYQQHIYRLYVLLLYGNHMYILHILRPPIPPNGSLIMGCCTMSSQT